MVYGSIIDSSKTKTEQQNQSSSRGKAIIYSVLCGLILFIGYTYNEQRLGQLQTTKFVSYSIAALESINF